MTPIQQLYLGVGASKKTYLDDVFSTYVYTGSTSAQTFNNGIDISNEGGMVWSKYRTSTSPGLIFDTERGRTKYLKTAETSAEGTDNTAITSFNSNGFSVGANDGWTNWGPSNTYASWSFRKAKGFFDVVTYTGNGTSGRTISHSLGCVPGFIMVKCTSHTEGWEVYHRSVGPTKQLTLNSTDSAGTSSSRWNDTQPTSSVITLGDDGAVNSNGKTYVAYVFAGGESTAATARSVEFDGTNDQLLLETNSDLAFGTGDFTIEFWVKPQTLGYAIFFDMRPNPAATQGAYPTIFMENDILGYHTNSGTRITGNKLSKDQWQHIALSRSGTSTKMFVNGTQVGSTYSDSTNYLNGDTTIGQRADGSTGDFDGYISNLRVVKGTAVYTSSFRPPTKPLANITNTKLLCCNNSSTTGSTVTPSTITADGTTASTDSPFDDPAGFKFGDSKEGIIKCGTYKGSGSAGLEVNIGWEPTWIMMKTVTRVGDWYMMDSMRGVVSGGDETLLKANTSDADALADVIEFTSTGFKVISTGTHWNNSAETYSFTAIRRSDGYCGKPADAGTDVFAIDTGNSSSTIPNFDSGFPVDFAWAKLTGSAGSWYTSARLIQGKELKTDQTAAESAGSNKVFDSNVGWHDTNGNSGYISHMWKRHAGFDVVTYDGLTGGKDVPHSLGKTPEMYWIKSRSQGQDWNVYHSGMNGGSSPEGYVMILNGTMAENNAGGSYWNAPTSTHLRLKSANATSATGNQYIAMLFASVDGISSVGSYSGSNSNVTLDLGFSPRFMFIKQRNGTNVWMVFDTLRGMGTGNVPHLHFNNDAASVSDRDWLDPITDGVVINTGIGAECNSSGNTYIYYAHA